MSGSDGVFNVAKGKGGYYAAQAVAGGGKSLVAVLLKVVEADDVLNNHTTLADLLGGANTECNATGYVRQTMASPTEVIDNTANTATYDSADITWPTLGGAVNNTVVKIIVCYNPDTTANGALGVGHEANLLPISYHTFDATTDGSDLTSRVTNFLRGQ